MIRAISKNSLAWASTQFDLTKSGISLYCPLEEALGPYAFRKECTAKTEQTGQCDRLPYLDNLVIWCFVHGLTNALPQTLMSD